MSVIKIHPSSNPFIVNDSGVIKFKAERELNKVITELNPESIIENSKHVIMDYFHVLNRQNL